MNKHTYEKACLQLGSNLLSALAAVDFDLVCLNEVHYLGN